MRRKAELDWTKVLFAQRAGILEYYVGSRLIGSPSLARLAWFPKSQDGVLRLVFDDTEIFICPLEAAVEDWERKIRDWAAYTQQIPVEDLLIPANQRKKKEAPTLSKATAPSARKSESDIRVVKVIEPERKDSPVVAKRDSGKKEISSSDGSDFFASLRKSPLVQKLSRMSVKSPPTEEGRISAKDSRMSSPAVVPSMARTSFTSSANEVLPVAAGESVAVPDGAFGSAGSKLTNGKWKSCWYRLAEGKLMCFDSFTSKLPISFMEVRTLCDFRLEEESKKRFVVCLFSQSSNRKMMFDSKEVAEEWIARLRSESAAYRSRTATIQKQQQQSLSHEPMRSHSSTSLEAPDEGVLANWHTAEKCLVALDDFDGEDEIEPTGSTDLGTLLDDILEMDDELR